MHSLLVNIGGNTKLPVMIDAISHIVNNADCEGFIQYAIQDGGEVRSFYSSIFLDKRGLRVPITTWAPRFAPTIVRGLAREIIDMLDNQHAILIADLIVYEDFNSSQKTHYGQPAGNFTGGMHAMVMIGYSYNAKDDKFVVLVQNSWAKKPFVEMDLEYLLSCEPNLLYTEDVSVLNSTGKKKFALTDGSPLVRSLAGGTNRVSRKYDS